MPRLLRSTMAQRAGRVAARRRLPQARTPLRGLRLRSERVREETALRRLPSEGAEGSATRVRELRTTEVREGEDGALSRLLAEARSWGSRARLPFPVRPFHQETGGQA